MNRFELSRRLFGADITVQALCFETELHVSIYGGDRPHIGAVTVADREENFRTTQFPGHREAVVSEDWAHTLLEHGFSPVVVEAGIHYDGLDRSGIQAVLACTDEMKAELLEALGGK